MRERAFGTEERDTQRLFNRQACAHDLAKYRADGVARKAPGARFGQPLDDPTLALRIVKARRDRGALDLADGQRDGGALLEQRENLVVHLVDART